jgi:hypothetical protein
LVIFPSYDLGFAASCAKRRGQVIQKGLDFIVWLRKIPSLTFWWAYVGGYLGD